MSGWEKMREEASNWKKLREEKEKSWQDFEKVDKSNIKVISKKETMEKLRDVIN